MAQIGYFGVIIPPQDYYQGFFLHDDVFMEARMWLDKIQAELGGRYVPPSVTARDAPGVSQEDQPWVGAISAAISKLASMKHYQEMAVPALALFLVTGYKHFIIVAHPEKTNTGTTIQNFPHVTNADDMRKQIEGHPLVLGIKTSLMISLMRGRTKSAGKPKSKKI